MTKRRPIPNNCYTIVAGKVYGAFDPVFRADVEAKASAAGLPFDGYMVREFRDTLRVLQELVA